MPVSFYPSAIFHRITDIPSSLFRQWGIKVVVLDIDNTLTTHNNPNLRPAVLRWLEQRGKEGYRLVILSNNYQERVEPFAQALGLDYTARAWKPSSKGFARTAARYGVKPGEMVIIGDQIFTDILGGNLFGARSVLVEPMEPEKGPFFRFKRRLERVVLKRYGKKTPGKGKL